MQIWHAATQEGSSGPASRLHSALMAVLTHMVGRLGSLAIQDPHIQGVLYALLQKGLEGSSAEQEVYNSCSSLACDMHSLFWHLLHGGKAMA